jgi:amino acid transporter
MRKQRVKSTGDDRVRFSFWELLAFSSGGVIGSGWLLGPEGVTSQAKGLGWLSWLIAGVAVLIIGLVMMELGRAWGQDGGLIWWPLNSSGPVVATVVVAAAWIFYAANPASEAEAAVEFCGHWLPWLVSDKNHTLSGSNLTWAGVAFGAVPVLLLAGINMLGLRLVARVTVVATVIKVLVPGAVLALLIRSGIGGHVHSAGGASPGDVLRAITNGGVIYAYTGFQATADFGGRVRERDRDRLPLTVIVPVLFGLVFFTLLQWLSVHAGLDWSGVNYDSPYVGLAAGIAAMRISFAWLVRLDEFVSPLGCGLVYTAALGHTTENISLHGLIPDAFSSRINLRILGRTRPVAWVTLAINASLSLVILACLHQWATLAEASGIITLFVYATPSVSHAALLRHTASQQRQADQVQRIAERLRSTWIPSRLAPLSFWLMTVILYWANWQILLPAIGLIAGVTALLIVVRPRRWRKDLAWPDDMQSQTWQQWRVSREPAWWLACYGCGLAALNSVCGSHHSGILPWFGMASALALAMIAFGGLVDSSARYMALHPPADRQAPPDPPDAETGPEPLPPG